jgi:hypothetical protein
MEKEIRWKSLLLLQDTKYTSKSIVACDFNMTWNNIEKRGGSIIRDPFREWMEELMAKWDLTDTKPSKGKYT